MVDRASRFPLGAEVTLEELEDDPHPTHHRLRASEPVSWLPCLDGWLVTSHADALEAMRDAERFTVDDPRFTTARVIGPSMLSLDGDAHDRHREAFSGPFRAASVNGRFGELVTSRARDLTAWLAPRGEGELRRGFAGPMAASILAEALGMEAQETGDMLRWYDAIVNSVTVLSGGGLLPAEGLAAFGALRGRLQPAMAADSEASLLAAAANRDGDADGETLSDAEIASNAAVLLFGGIETTEGMIANAALELLSHPGELDRAREDPAALEEVIDESLRLEPAAAVVDRYATADTTLGDAEIEAGELVRISIAAANRDPVIFPDPDEYLPGRPNVRRHIAFAQGPHVCVGIHLARLEARAALAALITLPGLRLAPEATPRVRGLVFRKPEELEVIWDV